MNRALTKGPLCHIVRQFLCVLSRHPQPLSAHSRILERVLVILAALN